MSALWQATVEPCKHSSWLRSLVFREENRVGSPGYRMPETSSNREIPAALAIVVIFLTGLVLALLSFLVTSGSTLFTILLGSGTALLAAGVVVSLERLIPPWSQRIKVFRTHADVYSEFERMLRGVSDGPHVIRTINSFLPEKATEDRWDDVATSYLKLHPDTAFIRVVVGAETEEWRARIQTMKTRYGKLTNYHQHVAVTGGSVAPIEMFLVDASEVLLSFGTPEKPLPPVTFGLKLRDPDLCRQLEAYHRSQLEGRLKDEELHQSTLERLPAN
jgi:ABC-type multidrug transport system fused ATPase/permease subunit